MTANKSIKASALIEKIKAGDVEVDVENDEDCNPGLMSASIEVDGDNECSITAYYYYQEDQPNRGVSLGDIVVEVEGVRFTAERIAEDEHDRFEVGGRDIDYDKDLTEGDLIAAIEENVDLPEYSSSSYEFDESDVTDEELKDAIDEKPEYFAMKDDVVYGFDSEDDIPDDDEYERIDSDEAIDLMIENRQNIEFELWG